MAYINPTTVISPKVSWKLFDVLHNGGDGEDSLAVGEWDGRRVLAARWNGSSAYDGIGNPQSRGIPTWFVIPDWLCEPILTNPKITAEKIALAKALLNIK